MDGNFDDLLKEVDAVLGKPKTERKNANRSALDVPSIVDDELKKLGYNDNARLALISNLGRENSWNPDTIFGGHSDPANNQYNRGIISWQKDRRTNLENFVRQNGGDFTPSEDNLRLQTRFLDKELQTRYAPVGRRIKNPNLSLDEAYPLLQKYIRYQPQYEPDNKKWEAKAKQRGFGINSAPDYSNLLNEVDSVLASQPTTNYDDLLKEVDSVLGQTPDFSAEQQDIENVQNKIAVPGASNFGSVQTPEKTPGILDYNQAESPLDFTKPLTDQTGAPVQDLDAEYQKFLAFTKQNDTPENRRAFDAAQTGGNFDVTAQGEVSAPQVRQAQIQQQPAPIQNLNAAAPASLQNNFGLTGKVAVNRTYRQKPDAANFILDAAADAYGRDVLAADRAYRNLTGKPLIGVDENRDKIQSYIDSNFDAKTGTIPKFSVIVEQNISDAVNAYNQGGESGLKAYIDSQNANKTQAQNEIATRQAQINEARKQADIQDAEAKLRQQAIDDIAAERGSVGIPLLSRPDVTFNEDGTITPRAASEEEIQAKIAELRALQPTDEQIAEAQTRGANDSRWSGAVSSAAGRLDRAAAGILRPFESVLPSGTWQSLARRANQLDVYHDTTKRGDDSVSGQAVDLVAGLPLDLLRLGTFTKLGGGAVIGFAADAASQTSGAGANTAEITKQGVKSGTIGALFPASRVVGAKAGEISKVLEPVARIGTIGGGTYTVERAFGSTHEQALNSAIVNSLFEVAGEVKGKIGRVWSKGKPVDVGVDKDGNVSLVRYNDKANPNRVDFELVLDPESQTYQRADAAKNVTPNRETVPQTETAQTAQEAENRNLSIDGKPLKELAEKNPLRYDTPDKTAVEAVRKENSREQKIAQILADGKARSIEDIRRATKYSHDNVMSAFDNLFKSRTVEILPDNSFRLINEVPKVEINGSNLFDAYKEVQSKSPIRLAPSAEESQILEQQKKAPETIAEVQAEAVGQPFVAPEQLATSDLGRLDREFKQREQERISAENAGKESGTAKVVNRALASDLPKQTVYTERGTKTEVTPKVIDASQLITSLDAGYPQEFQPRDRGRAASTAQISEIANKLNPALLDDSPKASDGRPLVVPVEINGEQRFAVISGNGRTAGIKEAYKSGTDAAKNYRKFAREKDNKSLASNPVYVGVLNPSEITDLATFAKEANESPVAQMSATEQAKSDAERLDSDTLSLFVPAEDGSIHSAANRDFIRSFMEKNVNQAERNRLMDAQGNLNQDGINRVRNAIFAKAYADTPYGLSALQKIAESTDNNVKRVTNALLQTAGKFTGLKQAIADGVRYPGLDITPDITRAVEKYSFLKSEGTPVETYLRQQGLFGDDMSPVQKYVLQVFDNHAESAKALSGILNNYVLAADALGNPQQAGLFGDGKSIDTASLIRAAVLEYEAGNYDRTEQTSIFDLAAKGGNQTDAQIQPADSQQSENGDSQGAQEEVAPKNVVPENVTNVTNNTGTSPARQPITKEERGKFGHYHNTLISGANSKEPAIKESAFLNSPSVRKAVGLDSSATPAEVSAKIKADIYDKNIVPFRDAATDATRTDISPKDMRVWARKNNLPAKDLTSLIRAEGDTKQRIADKLFLTPEQVENADIDSILEDYARVRPSAERHQKLKTQVRYKKAVEKLGETGDLGDFKRFLVDNEIEENYARKLVQNIRQTETQILSQRNAETNQSERGENGVRGNEPENSGESEEQSRAQEVDKPLYSAPVYNKPLRLNFRKSIRDIVEGNLPHGTPVQVIEGTPEVYRLIGAKNLPVVVDYDVLDKILLNPYKHKNDISPEMFEQIPGEISNPIIVAKYTDRNTNEIGLNALTSLTTPDGRMVVVGLKFNKKSGRLTVNKIATTHAKNINRTFEDWEKNKAVLYVNTKLARSLATTYGSPLASVVQKAEQANSSILTERNLRNKPNYNKPAFDSKQEESLYTDLESLAKEYSQLKTGDERGAFIEKQLEKDAIIRRKRNEVFLPPNLKEILRETHGIVFKQPNQPLFYGTYQNADHTARVTDALKNMLNFPMSAKAKENAGKLIKAFEDAADNPHGDTRVIAANKDNPFGLKSARQEEGAHQEDSRDGYVSDVVVPSVPAGKKAKKNLQKEDSGYKDASDVVLNREVGAKVFVDGGHEELGISLDENDEIGKAMVLALLNNGKTATELQERYGKISEQGKKYADYAIETEKRSSGLDGQDESAGTAPISTERGSGSQIRRVGLQDRSDITPSQSRNAGSGLLETDRNGTGLERYQKSDNTSLIPAQKSIDKITSVRDKDGNLLAPNGKKSNLNEHLWNTVRTPEFKAWFGDWENSPEKASKVVDENGEPLTVYHGTKSDVDIFDIKKAGQTDGGYLGKAFYLTENPRIADSYTTKRFQGDQPNILPLFVNLRNPSFVKDGVFPNGKTIAETYKNFNFGKVGEQIKRDLIKKGSDGVFFNTEGENVQIVAFKPNQIKSIFNNGEFSTVRDEILYSKPRTETSGKLQKAYKGLVDIANIPKSLKSSVDLSAALRQGAILSLSEPKLAGKAFIKQLASLSEARHRKFVRDLNLHPAIEAAEEAGLYLSNLANDSGELTDREEAFMSKLVGDDPVFQNKAGEKIRRGLTLHVRASERAYTTYLDSIRIEAFQKLGREILEYNFRKGRENDPEQIKALAKFINYATGRGDLGMLNDAAPVLNATFFSARYWASRIQLLNPAFYAKLPPGTRKIALRKMMMFAGATALAMTLLKYLSDGETSFDPRNPDFLKLRVGSFHFDPGAGFIQNLRYAGQLALAAKDRFSGKKQSYGEAPESRVTKNMLRSKLAPAAGAFLNVYTGKDFIGQPATLKSEALNMISPMIIEDAQKAYQADKNLGLIKLAPSIFGVGVSVYDPNKKGASVDKQSRIEQLKQKRDAAPNDTLRNAYDRMIKKLEEK